MARSFAIPITVLTLGALWCIGMSRSPVPFGSRYVGGSQVESDQRRYDVAYYELEGNDALQRARDLAESLGYKAQRADDGGVTLTGDRGLITIQRGHFVELRDAFAVGPQAQVDDRRDAAVIAVAQLQPGWRSAFSRN
jgi:hypothetical protein